MKTSYSRRELYALGEPIGDSSTYKTAGRRVFGGGGGGILGDIASGVSDAISGVGDIGQGAINAVGEAGKGLDQGIRSEIPGGYATLAALAAGTGGLDGFLGSAGAGSGEALSGIDLGGAGGSPASWLNGSGAAGAGSATGLSGIDLGGAGGSPGTMGGSYADAIGADNIDVGGGYNPATGAGDAATAAGAAATGLTSSAGTAYGLPAGGLSSLLGKGSGSGSGGLTLGGAGLGAAGLAALMSMLKSDSSRYGVPGRQDNAGPMSQFKYNPASFSANRPDPSMFRPQGMPTAKIGYADGGPIQMGQGGPMEQVPDPDAVPPAVNSNVMMMARGGLSSLGGYSDGGRLLKGPGDGMSDNIPAQIGRKQPARLADGEFVVPADVVSHLGNGSTDAGAKQLYKMMDRIRSARTGRKAQGKEIKADKFLPK